MDTMTTEPTDPPEPPGRRGLRRRGLAAAAVVVAGVAVGATGVAMAADGGSSPSPGATSGQDDRSEAPRLRGPGMMGMHGRGLGMPGGWGALHGELVVPDGDGGYETVRVQGGEVTAVSGSSVTVKSDDGFSQKYDITDDTLVNSGRDGIDSIEVGEDVRVQGVETDGGVEALHVLDVSQVQRLHDRFAPPRPNDDHGSGRGTTGESTSFTGLRGV